jgi:hypothetical protein
LRPDVSPSSLASASVATRLRNRTKARASEPIPGTGQAGPPRGARAAVALAGASTAAAVLAVVSRAKLEAPTPLWILAVAGGVGVLLLAAPAWVALGWRALGGRLHVAHAIRAALARDPAGRSSAGEVLLLVCALGAGIFAGTSLASRFWSYLEPLTFPSLGAVWPLILAVASATVAVTVCFWLMLVWRVVQRSVAGTGVERALHRSWVAVRGPRAGLAALVSLAVAYAILVPDTAWPENSHYALIRSLADGTPIIDRFARETGDAAYFEGHLYSNKAPGLAFLALPLYLVLDWTGVRATLEVQAGGQDAVMKLLSLWVVVVPAGLLLYLVRRLAGRVEPGFGTAAAVTLGLGTLILPYATTLYSHVLSAFLGFAAFSLLWRERNVTPKLGTVLAAGVLAGLAVTTEYPLVLVGVVLGFYAISGTDRLRSGLAYSVGALAGTLPLFLYNRWAFGSFAHLSYADQESHSVGFLGLGVPRPSAGVELLLSSRGLLVCAPVLVAGAVGTVLLYRRGRRAEASVIGAVALVFLAYNSGWLLSIFGGPYEPGPRFLITALPFLAIPLAIAYRRFTAVTLGLAAASATLMTMATATSPPIGDDGDIGLWLALFTAGDFRATVVTPSTDIGWLALLAFLAPIAAALAFTAAATDWSRSSWRGPWPGVAALLVWGVIALLAQVAAEPVAGPSYALGLVCLSLGCALVGLLGATRALAGHDSRQRVIRG